MISFIRKALSSWIVLGLLGLVLVAFIVTGVQDPFGGGGGAKGAGLANVGGEQVSEAEFSQQWRRAIERLRERDPSLTAERAAREGGVEAVLSEMISGRALEVFGAKQGVVAGPALVDAEIAAIPAFQFGGKFSQRAYEDALKGQNLTDREVREGLQGDLLRRQLVAPVGAGARIPDGVAGAYARVLLEGRQGLIGVVPTAAIPPPPAPSDAVLAKFYADERAAFTVPERRVFRYALLEPASVTASEAEIAAYYAKNAARFGGVARRALRQAVLPDQGAATRVATAARAGQGLGADDTGVSETSETEFAAATSAAVARAAFAAPVRGVAGPVQSELGWHVVIVEAATAGQARPLADVRGEIVTAIEGEKRASAAADTIDKVQIALSDGDTFAEIARRFGLATVTTPPVTSTGATLGGAPLGPALQPLVTAAFETDPGDDASIEDLSEGRAALKQLVEVVPSSVPPLAERRQQVAQAWAGRQRIAGARAQAEQVARAVRQGQPMAALLAARRLPPPQPVGGRRIDLSRAEGGQIPPPVIMLFSLLAGGVGVQAAEGGQGFFIVQAVRVAPGDPAAAPAIAGDVRRQLEQAAAGELAAQFARAAEADVGVKRNDAAIAAVRARQAGLADVTAP